MLLSTGPPNWPHSCRHPPRASGMQQGRHSCLQQQHWTSSSAHHAAILQPRQSLTAPSAAAAQLHELEQLEVQQLQQLAVPVPRPAVAVVAHTSNGHSQHNITSSISTVPQFVPLPSPRPSSYTAKQKPTALVSLLVIEAFAGSYSAGRLTARLNSSSTGMSVAAYAAVELDPAFMQRAPDSTVYGIPDHETRTLIINGSITDPTVHGKLLRFVQQMLQQSTDGTGPVIDGVMLLGGPPCTMYSNCQTYQLPLVIEPDPDSFRRKLFASDRVVTGFLQLYSILKTACADPRWTHPSTKQSVPSCILMENPFSPSYMPIKYTPAETAASQGRLKPRQIKMIEKQNLSGRHFLQPYLAHNGGELYVSLHCWCSYAHLTHPKKPTYVFSDLKGLQDTPCICRLCRPEGKNLKTSGFSRSGRLIEVPVYQQHYIKVQEMENGDGGERATWPDAWLDRMAWLFSTSILAQRRPGYSSSSGSSRCGSGGPRLPLPVHDRQRRCSSTAADHGSSSSTAAGNGSSSSTAAGDGSSSTVAANYGNVHASSSKLSSSTGSCDAAAAAVDAAALSRKGCSPSRVRLRRSRGSNSSSSSSDQSSSHQSSATSSSSSQSSKKGSSSPNTASGSGLRSASSSGQQADTLHHDDSLELCSIGNNIDQSSSNKSRATSSSGRDSNAASSSGDCISPSSSGQSIASSSSNNSNSSSVIENCAGNGSSVRDSAASSNSIRRNQDRRMMERHSQLPSIFDLPL